MLKYKYVGILLLGLLAFLNFGCPPSPTTVTVPDVQGMTETGAALVLGAVPLQLGAVTTEASLTVDVGLVIRHTPAAGTSVEQNTAVDLVVSSGVEVPNLFEQTQDAAEAALTAAHLQLGDVTTEASETIEAGHVISQTPTGGTHVNADTAVDLVISTGPGPVADEPTVGWSYIPTPNSIWGLNIENASDGGYLVSGGDTGYHMYGLKLSASGAKSWELFPSRIVGTAEYWRCTAKGLVEADDGGFVFLGRGQLPDDEIPTDTCYVLVKYDSGRNQVWEKAYSPYRPGTTVYCGPNNPAILEPTGDGGYAAFGVSYIGPYQSTILKTDSLGELGTSGFVTVIDTDNNGDYPEEIEDGQQTSDGGYVLAGNAQDGGQYYALIIKTDGDGGWQWSQLYQYTEANHGALAHAVTQTANGSYLVAGDLINNITKALMYGTWLAKLNSEGEVEWSNWEPDVQKVEDPRVIKETPDGGFIVGGKSHAGYMMLSKFSAAGVLLWNFEMEEFGAKRIQDLVLNEDGSCVVVGSGGTSGPTAVVRIDYVFVPQD
ncbi:MAG TPA: PASTA domain-containing protein [Candidatus Hydrogenedentes bacterium]|nr:PASTA domain-containing protein [Candidatus Hydrogenedentota bacterium]HQH52087.1 PASTA domain-containing protein [Candidatus Hydrogenedentota bacterium]